MKTLSLFFLFIVLAACAPPAEAVPLEGTRWSLVSLNRKEVRPGTVITLAFEAERFSGRAGCNNYGAAYHLEPGNRFIIGEGSVTEMACSEPQGVMEQESEYTRALWQVTHYKVEGDTLLLTDSQEVISLAYRRLPVFGVRPADLHGTSWKLTAAPSLGEVDLAAFTLHFDEDTYRGSTVCRDYEGTYRAEDDRIAMLSLAMTTTEADCSEQELTAEHTFTSLLGTIWQYNISGTRLELYTDKGEMLSFDAVSYP